MAIINEDLIRNAYAKYEEALNAKEAKEKKEIAEILKVDVPKTYPILKDMQDTYEFVKSLTYSSNVVSKMNDLFAKNRFRKDEQSQNFVYHYFYRGTYFDSFSFHPNGGILFTKKYDFEDKSYLLSQNEIERFYRFCDKKDITNFCDEFKSILSSIERFATDFNNLISNINFFGNESNT